MNFPCGTKQIVSLSQSPRIKTDTLGDWLQQARTQIAKLPDEPMSSVHALIGFVLDKSAHFGISHPEYRLLKYEKRELDAVLGRLLSGEPLPYITGIQEFYGLPLKVTKNVLIPRPETERLVEGALSWLKKHPDRKQIVDVGTGSGCVALAIARHASLTAIVSTDISFEALQLARENAVRLNLNGQISFIQCDLLSAINRKFDMICANLPYIPTPDLSGLAVRDYEPLTALDGGYDGLRYIKLMLNQSQGLINDCGIILLEIESSRACSMIDLAKTIYPAAAITLKHDLAGLPRLVSIEFNGGK